MLLLSLSEYEYELSFSSSIASALYSATSRFRYAYFLRPAGGVRVAEPPHHKLPSRFGAFRTFLGFLCLVTSELLEVLSTSLFEVVRS